MRIATWNVERLKHNNDKLLAEIEAIAADILVLTETDERLCPDYPYCFKTSSLKGMAPTVYKETENRVSIYSKYKCIRRYPTFDEHTSCCVELETDYGSLVVYGTIIGVYGNRNQSFESDLRSQLAEILKIIAAGKNVCVIGDYNLSFGDNYYYTKSGRSLVQDFYYANGIDIVTADRTECVDHIAISGAFLRSSNLCVTNVDEWNGDKNLSDHKGIMIDLCRKKR